MKQHSVAKAACRRPIRTMQPCRARRACVVHLRASSHPTTPSSSVDVAIVGGGPAGLAAAHALAKVLPPGSKIALFDKVPDVSLPRGAGLRLEVNGLKALRGISQEVYDAAMARHSFVPSRSETRSPDGKVLQAQDMAPGLQAQREKYGMTNVNIGWHELVSTLAELLPPQVQVHTGARALHYEEDERGVTLHLQRSGPPPPLAAAAAAAAADSAAPGTQQQQQQQQQEGDEGETFTVTAGLLVAADGYFSRVREQCLGDGPPLFDNSMVWRARVDAELARQCGYQDDTIVWYFGANRVLLVYPIGPGHLVWTASCPQAGLDELGIDYHALSAARRDSSAQSSDYLQRSEANGRAAKERLLRAFAGYEAPVLALMAATAPESVVEQGLHVRAAGELTAGSFGRGRVVLLGDAAHPLRPTGQGTSQALEDGLALGRFVQQDGGGFGGLDAFRAHRAARLGPIMMHAEVRGKASYTSDVKAGAASLATAAAAAPAPTGIWADYEGYVYQGEDFSPLLPWSG